MITFAIPIRTHSKLNQRIHWGARAKQAKAERTATWAAALPFAWDLRWGANPAVVTLTRVSPRELDDDNLRGALKAVRDEVARLLGVDDRDARVQWRYGQEKGKPAVRVEVRDG